MGTSRNRLHLSWGCNENQGLGMFELEKERMALCRRENRSLNVHGGKYVKPDPGMWSHLVWPPHMSFQVESETWIHLFGSDTAEP